MALLGGARDLNQTTAYLERNLQHWLDYGYGLWILCHLPSGRVAGRAVLRHLPLDGRDEVEVGYALFADFWGRGLATEIGLACMGYARDPLHLDSVVAITRPENAGSQRVMQKIGLVYEKDLTHDGLRHVLYRSPPLQPSAV